METVLPDTSTTTATGHLSVGGCDVVELAERYGTPLWVFDRATFESRAKSYTSALSPSQVAYAGKAFLCIAICELVDSLGLSLDVCTGGELATALAAGFPPERIMFHGNNKSLQELIAAREANVGHVVVDSFDEMDRIIESQLATRLLLRVAPGVEAHTHEFVQTGQEDSKFGFPLAGDLALEGIGRAMSLERCELVGVHAHIGSQIFEIAAFELEVQRLADLLKAAKDRHGFEARELNLGGGLGIAYTRDEAGPDPSEVVARLAEVVEREFSERSLSLPEMFVEPGRSLIGNASVTVYRVGTIKHIPGVRTFVAVDGGMSDNIRPALYGSRYEALLANRADAPPGPRFTICGKHCESGDILIRDVHLPVDVAVGDLVCIPATGAYTFSMASNYNRVPRPPVVMVQEGKAIEIVGRETDDDLLRLDRRLDGSAPER